MFERVVAAKKAGQTDTDYDVIELGGDEVTKYVDEGGEDFFVPLDKSKIPNIDNLQVESTFRNDLVMPYRGTTVVLAYNSETVENPPETAGELYQWIKDHPGRFAYNTPSSGGAGGSFVTTSIYNFMDESALTSSDPAELYQWIKDHPGRFAYNTPSSGGAGGSFVTTSIYNFMDESALTSSDPANKEQWDQGFELLKELHPYMYKSSGKVVYPNKNQGTLDLLANKEVDMIPAWADMAITQMKQGTLPDMYKSSGKVVYPNKNQGTLDLLANKEVDMIPAWADMAITQMKQGTLPESIKITQIDPSFTGSPVVLGIPSIGSDQDGAYAFLNYMLTPEAQNIALDSMAAIPVIDFGLLDQELTKTIEDLKIEEFRIGLNYMLTPEAQNIALDSMAAIPVIDFGLLDQELTKTIEDLKIEEFRIGSLGNLGTELYEEWDSQIGTLE